MYATGHAAMSTAEGFALVGPAVHSAVLRALLFVSGSGLPLDKFRPGSYVAFLPCRMQSKQKIMRQIISLSIVSIAFDTAEMRRMNRA